MLHNFLNPRFAGAVAGTMWLALALWAGEQKKFYDDDPMWREPEPMAVESAHSRKLSDYYDFVENTFAPKGERQSEAGRLIPARGVNTLGEAPDSAWYTSRHYFHPMSAEELARGAGNQSAPAKNECG